MSGIEMWGDFLRKLSKVRRGDWPTLVLQCEKWGAYLRILLCFYFYRGQLRYFCCGDCLIRAPRHFEGPTGASVGAKTPRLLPRQTLVVLLEVDQLLQVGEWFLVCARRRFGKVWGWGMVFQSRWGEESPRPPGRRKRRQTNVSQILSLFFCKIFVTISVRALKFSNDKEISFEESIRFLGCILWYSCVIPQPTVTLTVFLIFGAAPSTVASVCPRVGADGGDHPPRRWWLWW